MAANSTKHTSARWLLLPSRSTPHSAFSETSPDVEVPETQLASSPQQVGGPVFCSSSSNRGVVIGDTLALFASCMIMPKAMSIRLCIFALIDVIDVVCGSVSLTSLLCTSRTGVSSRRRNGRLWYLDLSESSVSALPSMC